jgi:lipopolysaccharide export LptBFGC system permease protein LptF
MWKKISLIALCLIIFTVIWLYINQKENEATAFKYAKEYVINQYNENGNLTNGGTRYDVGRGNYSVIVQIDNNNKYYLEVKLSNDLTLVSVEDDTSNIESSTE